MNNNIVSLRNYINNRDTLTNNVKVKTFCRLMKNVSDKVENESRNFVRINLDEIQINLENGDIILPENLFSHEDDINKTIAGFNTGISLVADRKSTIENKRVSLALMILGWYYNPNGNSISSDMEVLENFDLYMSKVPTWLQDFFINVFRKMNYEISFGQYYEKNFNNKIKNEIKEAFAVYNLNEEQLQKITRLIIKDTNKIIKEGEQVV